MSFFGQLMAGGLSGFGAGIAAKADDDEKYEAALALQREKSQAALDLQKQKAEERAFQISLTNQGKASSGSSSGMPIWDDLGAAENDPAKQDALIRRTKALLGDAAAERIASVFGRGGSLSQLADEPPTDETVRQAMAYEGHPQPPTDPKRSQDLAQRGLLELQRGFALLANKGQIDNYAKGEAGLYANDARAEAVNQELRKGKPLVEAADTGARVADPAEYDRNRANRERIDASVQNAKTRAAATSDTTDLKAKSATIKDIEGQIVELIKITGDEMRYNDDARKQAADMLPLKRAELEQLKRNGRSPAASYTPTASTKPKTGRLPTLEELRAKHAPR